MWTTSPSSQHPRTTIVSTPRDIDDDNIIGYYLSALGCANSHDECPAAVNFCRPHSIQAAFTRYLDTCEYAREALIRACVYVGMIRRDDERQPKRHTQEESVRAWRNRDLLAEEGAHHRVSLSGRAIFDVVGHRIFRTTKW